MRDFRIKNGCTRCFDETRDVLVMTISANSVPVEQHGQVSLCIQCFESWQRWLIEEGDPLRIAAIARFRRRANR